MREIPLTKGYVALVDDEDYDFLVSRGPWHVSVIRPGKAVYAKHTQCLPGRKRRNVFMHQLLLPDAEQADHINGDGLDNRRSNLRPATASQNMANRPRRRDSTSGFKGAYRDRGKFIAVIGQGGEQFYLGTFESVEDAAHAYDWAAIQVHGEFARTNFPREDYLSERGHLILTLPRWAQITEAS